MMDTNDSSTLPARSAKEQFDRQAAHYNAQWNTWTESTLNWLLDHADCRPDDAVLDVATGTGFTALAFAPHVSSVVGLDVSTGMLQQARAHQQERGLLNVTWQEGAAEDLPFADSTFTIVTCRVAPHHFLSIPQFLAEVRRVLRPGGRFVLADTCVPDSSAEGRANESKEMSAEDSTKYRTLNNRDNSAAGSAEADTEAGEWQNRVEALRDPSHVRNLSPQEWRLAVESVGLTVAELEGPVSDIAITLNDWIEKAGCSLEQAAVVREAFAKAPPSAQQTFHIHALPDKDVTFTWQRVVVKAVKNA